MFARKPAFSQFPGLEVASASPEHAAGRIDMRRELVHDSAYASLHGGMIELRVDSSRSGIGERRKLCDKTVTSANGNVE
jgi:hypothetical protein